MTTSTEAVTSTARGMDAFNHWRADAMAHFDAAIEADAGYVMAHIARGLFLSGGRNRAYAPAVAEHLDAARTGSTSAEPLYVDTLAALVKGRPLRAVAALERLLLHDPRDLFAHRVVQQELFWLGEVRWMREIADRAAPAWTGEERDYAAFASVRAFAHEETGDLDSAEALARDAVARNPGDPWGAHAVAHVLEMRGRSADGATWLAGLSPHWDGANQITHHLWWHYCLFQLELGEREELLEVLDQRVRNPESPLVQAAPDLYIDIQNVASLLLRLELRGVDVDARWETIADVCAARIDNHASPFTSAHAAMTLAATGRFDDAQRLVDSLAEFAASSDHDLAPRVATAALPAARACIAHRRGDYAAVVAELMPARRELWRLGGSHAQRDIFFQVLYDACRHSGAHDEMALLREEVGAIGFGGVEARSGYATAA